MTGFAKCAWGTIVQPSGYNKIKEMRTHEAA